MSSYKCAVQVHLQLKITNMPHIGTLGQGKAIENKICA